MNSRHLLQFTMRALKTLGFLLLVAGSVAIVIGVLSGDIEVGLALFFIPYLRSSSWVGGLAILLIFAGIAAFLADAFISVRDRDAHAGIANGESATFSKSSEMGGVVLIGPIPIVFGSSSRAALVALVAATVLVIAVMLFLLFLWHP